MAEAGLASAQLSLRTRRWQELCGERSVCSATGFPLVDSCSIRASVFHPVSRESKPHIACWTWSLSLRGVLRKCAFFAGIQKRLRVETTKKLDQLRHDAGPTGLVTGAQAGTVIAVEIFVEEYVVPPQRIG